MPGEPKTTAEAPLAAGKPPQVRIRALRRRIEASTSQAIQHARLTEAYTNSVERDLAEIARLEAELANAGL